MFTNETGNTFGPTVKTPVKWLEVPIQKFNAAVPHFVESLKVHQDNVKKLRRLEQWEEIKKEHGSATRTVKQLTSLLSEIDNLRNQVSGADLSKFDKLTSSSKQSALSAIRSHQASVCTDFYVRPQVSTQDEEPNPSDELQEDKLQIVADLTGEIQKQERFAASLERLHEDVEDINSLFEDLSQLVHHQGEHVEKIEEHVETTHVNVVEGERMLCQAAKYKTGLYPLAGALIGTVVGGPVGLLAGFKLGSLTAVGCGFLGFTGGRFLKHQNEATINEAENHRKDLVN